MARCPVWAHPQGLFANRTAGTAHSGRPGGGGALPGCVRTRRRSGPRRSSPAGWERSPGHTTRPATWVCEMGADVARIRALKVFSGIEYRADGRVYHVDTRHLGPNNTTGSSVANPSVFLWK